MPSKNVIKRYDAPAFYHVYNRGAGGQKIFIDDADRAKFLHLIQRYTIGVPEESEDHYPQFDIEVVAYCLMGNHFHLLLFQENDTTQITGFMRSLGTAYAMYFNRRHKLCGHLFQEIYRASHISDDAYLAHISRYIHLNPPKYKTYIWSSLPDYLGRRTTEWLAPQRVLDVTPAAYMEFLEDYRDRFELLHEYNEELAF